MPLGSGEEGGSVLANLLILEWNYGHKGHIFAALTHETFVAAYRMQYVGICSDINRRGVSCFTLNVSGASF